MFVSSNSFRDVKTYFSRELKEVFSPNEIKLMLKYLFCDRFKVPEGEYLLADQQQLSESDLLYFRKAVKRLKANEPFQYILGKTEFYGLELLCDHRALIPRPETEELVQWILENHKTPEAIVDICSGSGCIALALKNELPETKVFAWEYSDEALALIKDNVQHTNLSVELIHSDALKTNYQEVLSSKVDVIVSNPPYIPTSDQVMMEQNVLDFEPEMALFVANEDPMLFYREILQRSIPVLNNEGWVYFEVHEDLASNVQKLFQEMNFVNIELRKDLQGKDRMVRGQVVNCSHECAGSTGENS